MGKSYEDVKEKLEKAIMDAGATVNRISERATVAEWMTIWFEAYSKPTIRESTADSYYSCMKNHIFPNIGGIAIGALTSLDIQTMYNKVKSSGRVKTSENMPDRSLGSRVVHCVHMLLRQCLEQAVLERKIPYNPVNACKLPPKEKTEMRVVPPEKIGS